ncbi:WD repeat-containing protein 44 [Achroia grisella]|uniref:WD repeat-containing protein 44 n=1 Tax=Achroia grisella TaxID=688607 RepID=UPI0027D1F4EA|nr:WD repeat-containing protein 44 [Achroia grisella]
MGDSSDSDEFYDAEFIPIDGSNLKDTTDSAEKNPRQNNAAVKSDAPSLTVCGSSTDNSTVDDDRTTVKSVVQGRKRFQELRRCMQTEDDDEDVTDAVSSIDHQAFAMERPFKIIAHDTMSLQSMTSLGRIGKILSGAAESHPNLRDPVPSVSTPSREPSTTSDDPLPTDNRSLNALATAEPDVIASTKANSLKHNRGAGAIVAMSGSRAASAAPAGAASGPVAPPRKKKRNKLHGSQSLSIADSDNLSVCTTDTDEYRYVRRATIDKPQLDSLLVEPSVSNSLNQTMSLPSPASTIESLTREFQDSLELSQSKYALEQASSAHEHNSPGSRRPTTHRTDSALDAQDAAKGNEIREEERSRGSIRTHSEGRSSHSSLGNTHRRGTLERGGCGGGGGGGSGGVGGGSRRRSAGDSPALGLSLRTRTTSGHQLSDIEILEQVTVLNLDTGERVPLSVAEHKLPQCINPLSLHIMRLTSEYIGRANDDDNARETDEESESVSAGGAEGETKEAKREADRQTTGIRRKTDKLKRFFGSTMKKTVEAARSLAQEVHARHKEDVAEIADDVRGEHNIKLKASNSHKGPYDFEGCVRHVQEMGSGHEGAVWCCKFSVCGRLLATAGQDRLLRVWVTRDAYTMFQEMRTKYNTEQKSSPTPSQESLATLGATASSTSTENLPPSAPFHPRPFCVYAGHTSDLLDVSWSKNYFILSSSMDKTVRLWHICRGECLCCFQHIDFVTAIVFHPRDDRFFLSGSLDGKLRLWDIPDKKVAVWNEVDGKTKLITAANFCQNGKYAVVGTYDGRCIFYTTDQLKYYTQIDVRSTRGKNATGRKISGIEPMPNDDKILITSNDSRIRLYGLQESILSCKYKGYVNVSSQIKASFSHDGKYIVSGSENQCIYIWKTYHDYSKFTSVRRDRNDFWEGIKAHNAVVTCAVFAPNPDHMIRMIGEREQEARLARGEEVKDEEEVKGAEGGMVSSSQTGHVLVSADFNGCIKVFVHKAKPKHSSLPASALA